MQHHAFIAWTRRLAMPVGFSLLEVMLALLIATIVLLALAAEHSQSFHQLSATRKKAATVRGEAWRGTDLNSSSCFESFSLTGNRFLNCTNRRAAGTNQSKLFIADFSS